MSYDLLARTAGGSSSRREMRFVLGVAVNPFSVGSAGHWHIEGSRVRAIHAFVHFDGVGISLLSAHDEEPARLNGQPIPRTWTPVPIPSVITFGEASIMFGTTADEPVTRVISLSGYPGTDCATTAERLAPATQVARKLALVPGAVPSAAPRRAPSPPRRLELEATVIVKPQAGVANHANERKTKGREESTEPTQSARNADPAARIRRMGLAAVTVLLVGLGAFSVVHRPSAGAVMPKRTTVASPAVRLQPLPVASSNAESGPLTTVPPSRVPMNSADSSQAAAGDVGGDDERAAADAVIRGESDAALALYVKLAQAHPQTPVFSVARDILRGRARATEQAR